MLKDKFESESYVRNQVYISKINELIQKLPRAEQRAAVGALEERIGKPWEYGCFKKSFLELQEALSLLQGLCGAQVVEHDNIATSTSSLGLK